MINLDAKIPAGPIADKWENHKFSMKLVNPANKRKFKIIVGALAAVLVLVAAGAVYGIYYLVSALLG